MKVNYLMLSTVTFTALFCLNLFVNEAYGDEDVLEFNAIRADTKLQVKPLVIVRDIGPDIIQCLAKCLEHSPLCNGVNFLANDLDNYGGSICEILEDHFDDYMTREKLVCTQHWVYYGMSQISVCFISF